MKNIVLLGATGSIGASTVEVVLRNPDQVRIVGMVAHKNVSCMVDLVEKVRPDWVIMTDEEAACLLAPQLSDQVNQMSGMEAVIESVCADDVNLVIAAMVGAVGIPSALAAVEAGKDVALANKECLVAAGHLFAEASRRSGARIIPVDSEHAAVDQCLIGHDIDSVDKVLLTASGGPFRSMPVAQLEDITPEQAVAHPNWDMGAKISVDSATMMNKALELIEAKWLFNLKAEQLAAIIHPQSIVHAMVYYRDGSVVSQMGSPDMCSPIAYALCENGKRLNTDVAVMDLAALPSLDFEPIDVVRFPAMSLVDDVLRGDHHLAIWFNAANEEANRAFLNRDIPFTRIVSSVEDVLTVVSGGAVDSLDDVFTHDQLAREATRRVLRSYSKVT